mgnify:FL=1
MKQTIYYTLRINETLHDKLKYIAKEEMRSFNSELEYIMKQYIKDYEKKHGEIETFDVGTK